MRLLLLLAKQVTLGGSAALEGVMMKSPWAWALAVRLPTGKLHVERHEEPALSQRYPWARLPLIRGVVALWDALSVSYRALARSAQLVGGEEEMPKGALWGTVAVSLLLGIALFIVLPGFLAGLLLDPARFPLPYNLLAGLIKVGILVGYLRFIGRLPDIRRFFMYHGAEHKAIHAFEKGLPLTVENVMAQPRFHPPVRHHLYRLRHRGLHPGLQPDPGPRGTLVAAFGPGPLPTAGGGPGL